MKLRLPFTLAVFVLGCLAGATLVAWIANQSVRHAPDPIAAQVTPVRSNPATAPKPTVQHLEPEWAAQLRKKADQMGLQWQVFCVTSEFAGDFAYPYSGYAKRPEDTTFALPHWSVAGKTRESTARALLKALDSPPNRYPLDTPKIVKRPKVKCEPTIAGGPNIREMYADECGDCK